MPNLQAIKTKTKHVFQTDEVQNQILENLTLEEILEFIQELSKKTLEKKKAQDLAQQQAVLPPHIRQGIKESLAEIKNGNFVDTLPDEEVSIVNSIQKMKKLNYVHTA
jgi:hypothetical protein